MGEMGTARAGEASEFAPQTPDISSSCCFQGEIYQLRCILGHQSFVFILMSVTLNVCCDFSKRMVGNDMERFCFFISFLGNICRA
jgi:hypothetical protein